MKLDATLANGAWLAASLPERARFGRAAAKVEATQRRILSGYLRRNAGTAFGREHDFAGIGDWEAWAERVPIRCYDDFKPWIDRIAAGQAQVLTAEPVKLLEPTSGSSGAEKLVPYTRALQAEFHRAVGAWVSDLFLANPSLMAGRAYWSVTPQAQRESGHKSSVPVGFDEDSAYLGGIARSLVSRTMATSSRLKTVQDMDRFWKLTLLQLLGARDLRLISVWHPSYLSLLLTRMRRDWTELLDALEKGGESPTAKIRILPDMARAYELRHLGPDTPTKIWPDLGLVSCWGDAHAASGIEEIRAAFPGVRVQAKGLLATEAFISLPLGDLHPLAVRSHFFEFRDPDGVVHPAWSLEQGTTYAVIVTTGGGLYRYELRDLVEVTRFHEDLPSLRFVGKADNVVDRRGEKLNESFVAACLRELGKQFTLEPAFAMLAFDDNAAPGYTLYIESAAELPDGFAEELDTRLRENPHYELCVRLGQLRPVHVHCVGHGAYETYSQALVSQGMRLGDVKPTCLSRHSDWARHFSGSQVASTRSDA